MQRTSLSGEEGAEVLTGLGGGLKAPGQPSPGSAGFSKAHSAAIAACRPACFATAAAAAAATKFACPPHQMQARRDTGPAARRAGSCSGTADCGAHAVL